MAELKYKFGDKLLVNADIDYFSKGDIVTVVVDNSDDGDGVPYFVSNGTEGDWISVNELPNLSLIAEESSLTKAENKEVSQKLDLHTVNHIHSYYSFIIQEAAKADKSHEAINIALLSYIEGLKDGLSNG